MSQAPDLFAPFKLGPITLRNRFIRAGATGAHGTVNEPLNNVFPNAGVYLHYTFGYSLGESWLYNQRFLYWQNIYLGDPLASPYAERPEVTIAGGAGTLSAGKAIEVKASHAAGVARVDLTPELFDTDLPGLLPEELDHILAHLVRIGVVELRLEPGAGAPGAGLRRSTVVVDPLVGAALFG